MGDIIDHKSQFLHQLPILGRFIRPHLKGDHIRDEEWQAHKLVEQLGILDAAGVDGAFIFQFISQITPFDENPRYDLEMASSSLVKYATSMENTTLHILTCHGNLKSHLER